MKITWLLIALLLPQIGCTIFPNKYSAEEIEAWVIDADTDAPLEGVIVVAAWELRGGLELGNPVGNANLMETVTDKKGRFYFPAWGPVWKKGALLSRDPALYFFKRDYEHRFRANRISSTAKGSMRSSDWHGKTIKMKKFQGSLEEYARNLSFMQSFLDSIVREDCNWKKTPRLLTAVTQQNRVFEKEGIYTLSSYSLDGGYFLSNKDRVVRECGYLPIKL